jgi:hypothetical protein
MLATARRVCPRTIVGALRGEAGDVELLERGKRERLVLVRPELEYRAQRRRVVEAAHQDMGQHVEPANQIELLEYHRAARAPARRPAGWQHRFRRSGCTRGRRLEPVDRPITPMKAPAPISGDTSSTAGFGAVTPRSMTSMARQGQGASRLRVRLRYGELSLREDVSRPRALASPARRLYSSAAPLRRQVRQRPSSSGPGRRPFTAKTGVRFPLGAPRKTSIYAMFRL